MFEGEEAPRCENHAKALKQGRLTVDQVVMVPVTSVVGDGLLRTKCRAMGGSFDLLQAEGWCPGHPA